mgnify:CR=1 FL=1
MMAPSPQEEKEEENGDGRGGGAQPVGPLFAHSSTTQVHVPSPPPPHSAVASVKKKKREVEKKQKHGIDDTKPASQTHKGSCIDGSCGGSSSSNKRLKMMASMLMNDQKKIDVANVDRGKVATMGGKTDNGDQLIVGEADECNTTGPFKWYDAADLDHDDDDNDFMTPNNWYQFPIYLEPSHPPQTGSQ